jgi:hypothetical protein
MPVSTLLQHAYHGTDSPALLPGSMRNRFPCVCHSGMCGKLIWNHSSGDEVIFTQLLPPRPFSVFPSPTKSSLSLVDSSPNCRHELIVSSDGWHSACKPIAIRSLSFHCRRCRYIVVVPLLSSLSLTSSTVAALPPLLRCCANTNTTAMLTLLPSR